MCRGKLGTRQYDSIRWRTACGELYRSVLLACYLAIYNLLFSYIAQRFQIRNPFALAAIFTFTEYLRGVVFTGFPWLQFGYTQIDSPFAGIAPLLGVEGLTFFVMVVSGYFVLLVKNLQKRPLLLLP
ncbi:apolipoprotein N-acyltransferase [Actinobacillus equuli]|nr:apolipoprotein N-acyltransferase [Actinobacillus equuli]